MTDKKPKRPRDANQLAHMIAALATGEDVGHDPDVSGQRKGGVKGSEKRASSLTPKEREEMARFAATARWKKN